MPARSNEFQKLVYFVRKHAAPDANVTESRYLSDKSTGKPQEVDICIEFTYADTPIIICIECEDTKRKATKEWVQEMKGKHDDLPTNKLVLASRSGFTKQAIEKAQYHGIETIALDVLDEASNERLIRANILSFKVWSLTPTKVVIEVPADEYLPAEEVPILDDHMIFNQSGENIAIAKTLVHDILRAPKAREHFATHGETHHRNFNLNCQSPTETSGKRIYLRKDFPTFAVLRRIDSITISGNLHVEVSDLQLKHGKLKDTVIAWGTTTYFGNKTLVMASKGETTDIKFSFGQLPG